MGFQDYISESEASSFAGVTTNTLSRFAEAGYLDIEYDQDGLKLFSKGALFDLFGLTKSSDSSTDSSDAELNKPSPTGPTTNGLHKTVAGDPTAEVIKVAEVPKDRTETTPEESVKKGTEAIPPVQNDYQNGFQNGAVSLEAKKAHEAEQISDSGEESSNHKIEGITLEQEVTKLSHIVELQDKILDARESEIEALKSERDWLRKRVENLEQKGERDQLLLLSETQMMRKLLFSKQQNRSPLRAALEWFGLVKPEEPNTLPATLDFTLRPSNESEDISEARGKEIYTMNSNM